EIGRFRRTQRLMMTPARSHEKPDAPREIPMPGRSSNRLILLLVLDVSMLLLVCVLEALSLTGLALHEWLGFVLCPLVLLHVALQWDWFVTQFRRVMRPGAYRSRANSLLNIILLVVMAAVLLSGVLVSNQVRPVVGQALGRIHVWHEIHGWLNFVLVVLVGL